MQHSRLENTYIAVTIAQIIPKKTFFAGKQHILEKDCYNDLKGHDIMLYYIIYLTYTIRISQ